MNGEWIYTAESANSTQGGIVRMILDVYKTYGKGTHSLTFDYRATTSDFLVGVGVDYTQAAYLKSVSGASSGQWNTKTVTFKFTDDPASVEQMALWFSIEDGYKIAIKNISMNKVD